ncbi:MAG: efflux RND transporter permease subunit [Spirochaetales bacterium]
MQKDVETAPAPAFFSSDDPESFLPQLITTIVQRPFTVITTCVGICLFGLLSLFHLRIEYMPTLYLPHVQVITEYLGMSATEVENLITLPLENGLSTVKGLRKMEAITKEGVSTLSLHFDWKVDLRRVLVEVREKIDSTYPYLPYGIQKPRVFTEDLNAEPILVLAVLPKADRSLLDIIPLIRKELCSRLLQIEGVATLRIVGTREKEIWVEADRAQLVSRHIPLERIAKALEDYVFQTAMGTVIEDGREYLVKAEGGIHTLEDLNHVPMDSSKVLLQDVAQVSLREKEATSFFHLNGKGAVGIYLYRMPHTGSLNTAQKVLAQLPLLNQTFHQEFSLSLIQDTTEEIRASLESLLVSLGLGIFSICLVLFATYRAMVPALIIALGLPLCTFVTFLFMFFAHLSINTVSLGGIALGMGMVVDNSIVVLDYLLRNNCKTAKEIGKSVGKVLPSLTASTLTTLGVFLPVLFIPGLTGALFTELSLTISMLLLASFGVAIFVTPTLYACSKENLSKKDSLQKLETLYGSYLNLAFRNLAFPGSICVTLLVLGSVAFCFLPKQIFPYPRSRFWEIVVQLPAGTSLQETERVSQELEKRLKPLSRMVVARGGYDTNSLTEKGARNHNSWTVFFTLLLVTSSENPVEIERVLEGTTSISYHIQPPSSGLVKLLGGGSSLQVQLQGLDREKLGSYRDTLIQEHLHKYLLSYSSDTEATLPLKTFILDEPSALFHQLSPRYIREQLELALRGRVVTTMTQKGEEVGIRLKLKKEVESLETFLMSVPISRGDATLPAGMVGEVKEVRTYPELYRTQRKPSLTCTLHPLPHAKDTVERLLISHPFPPFLTATLIHRSPLEENALSILQVFGASLVLMYLLLGAQFESFWLPLSILTAFPLSAAGSFLTLKLMGLSLNLYSFLGILVLLGTALNGTILFTLSYQKKDMESIREASIQHARPLLTTVVTTLVALFPLLFSGKETLQTNTAAALTGGLSLGTLAILLLYPPFYKQYQPQKKDKKEP